MALLKWATKGVYYGATQPTYRTEPSTFFPHKIYFFQKIPSAKKFLIFSQKKLFQFSGNGAFLHFGKSKHNNIYKHKLAHISIFRTYTQNYKHIQKLSNDTTYWKNSYLKHFNLKKMKYPKQRIHLFKQIPGHVSVFFIWTK